MNIFKKADLNRFYEYALVLTNDEDDAFDLVSTTLKKWMLGEFFEIPEIERSDYFIELMRPLFYKWFDGKRMEDSPLDSPDVLSFTIPQDLQTSLESAQIKSGINALTPKEREILYLWSVCGLDAEKISKRLSLKKGKVIAKVIQIHQTFEARNE